MGKTHSTTMIALCLNLTLPAMAAPAASAHDTALPTGAGPNSMTATLAGTPRSSGAGDVANDQAPGKKTVNLATCNAGELIASVHTVNTTGGTLNLKPGCTYDLTAPDNADNGLPIITNAIMINGSGDTIQRDLEATTNFRIFEIDSPGNLALTNLTLRNGHAQSGGAIFVTGGALTTYNSTITGNTADFVGGGIRTEGATTLNTTTLTGNTAGAAGGVDITGGTTTINSSRITNNTATGRSGGFDVSFTATMILNSTLVTGNRCISTVRNEGGAAENEGTLTLNSSPVEHNTAVGGNTAFGGGIFNRATLNLNSSPVRNNTSGATGAAFGGGIFQASGGTATLKASPVTGNTASAPLAGGGGIESVEATLTLISSPVVGNHPDNCQPAGSTPGCNG